jgi:D-aminopeptidase
VLTSSLQIGKAYDATVRWIAGRSLEAGEAVMPCVTECDDSWLSDVLSFPLGDEDVAAALDAASGGPVEEGCVGSGVGMQCFDFKGGIGTASRELEDDRGGYTVGALVMTNHGTRPELSIAGVPVGEAFANELLPLEHHEGSCIVIVATDAPVMPHQLRRIAERAGLGLSRGGSSASNSSGEQFIAFSTATRLPTREPTVDLRVVADGGDAGGGVMSGLFRATIESTEEAVVNALLAAETTVGRDGRTYFALPVDRTIELLGSHGRLAG